VARLTAPSAGVLGKVCPVSAGVLTDRALRHQSKPNGARRTPARELAAVLLRGLRAHRRPEPGLQIDSLPFRCSKFSSASSSLEPGMHDFRGAWISTKPPRVHDAFMSVSALVSACPGPNGDPPNMPTESGDLA